MKNTYCLIAGAINLFTALVHTIGGQFTLVNPMLDSALIQQVKTEWLGAWHIITLFLFYSSYYLIKTGLSNSDQSKNETIRFIGITYLLFSVAFIGASVYMKTFAPQWIILMPIGLLALKACKVNKD